MVAAHGAPLGGGTTGAGAADANKKRDTGASTVEMVVRGVLPSSGLEDVLTVVRLLCPDSGDLGRFRDWDRVYNSAPEVRGPRAAVRLRKHLESPRGMGRPDWAEYSLLYYGLLDRRVPSPVEKRPVQTVPMGADAPKVVQTLGCVLQHEYVRQGNRFRTRTGLIVDVFVARPLTTPGDPDSAEAMMTDAGDAEGGLIVIEVSSDRGGSPEDLVGLIDHLTPLGVEMKAAH